MKNILLVSDNFLNGGLETRLLDEISLFKKHDCNIYLVCKKINPKYKKSFKEVLILNDTLQENELSPQSIKTARDSILSFCKKRNIDYIECHPFFLLLPAALAASILNIPTSYTLHGLISGNYTHYEQTTSILFYLILKNGFDQTFAVAEYLQEPYSFLSPNIAIARNGTNIEKQLPTFKNRHPSGKFAISSRLDSIKTQLIIDFLPFLHDLKQVNTIDIFGNGESINNLKSFITTNNYKKIIVHGWEDNLASKFKENNYDAIFGMGRIILDAINANIPAGILGYGGFAGFIKDSNCRSFAKTNLTSWQSVPIQNLPKQIDTVQKKPNTFILSSKNKKLFDNNSIWQNYYKTINNLSTNKKPTILLINDILNSSNNLAEFLNHFNSNYDSSFDIIYQTLYNQIVQKEIFQLKQTIVQLKTELSFKQSEIDSITNSTFWKSTKPIRSMLQKAHCNSSNKSLINSSDHNQSKKQ